MKILFHFQGILRWPNARAPFCFEALPASEAYALQRSDALVEEGGVMGIPQARWMLVMDPHENIWMMDGYHHGTTIFQEMPKSRSHHLGGDIMTWDGNIWKPLGLSIYFKKIGGIHI